MTAPARLPRPAARGGTGGAATRLSRHLRALVAPWRRRLVLVSVLVLAAAGVELVPPLVVRHVIDVSLSRGRTSGLGTAAALYLGAVTASSALTSAYGYLAATVAQRSLAGLRTQLFTHLLVLPISYHDRTPLGDSISRATADVDAIEDLFSSSVATLLGELARLVTVAAAMTALSPTLTGAAALVIPPLVVVTRLLRRRVRDAERASRIAVAAVNGQLAEDLAGVEVVRAFGRQAAFSHRFRLALRAWLRAGNRSVLFNAFYAPTLNVLAAVATALLLWLGGRHAFGMVGTSVGTLTAFVLLFARFFTPLVTLGDEWQTVQRALAGAERVFAVLDLPTDVTTNPSASDHHAAPGGATPRAAGASEPAAIELRDVTFGYQPTRRVLHEVSLTVQPGEHLAIVGPTGAGKSSLLSLIAGLHVPSTGQVRLAGHDPRVLGDRDRRTLLGYVPQTVTLFGGTVTDNVTLGDRDLADEQVQQAARTAGLDRFIAALPCGYDTRLSDSGRGSGAQLSAGQRQLIALARALVTQPGILLLDEATAVIDGASDATFRTALRDRVLPTGTAVLTVAHRLTTAREADRVVVLVGGRVREHGPPQELLAAGGWFADVVALDEAGYDWQHDA